MPAVHLGKVHLHWCDNCNLPIVEMGDCSICGEPARKVKITPPGDVRPAFDQGIRLVKDVIDGQWGEGYSDNLVDVDKVVLLNGCPAMDRMDEVIVDGEVVGIIRYSLKRKFQGRDPYQFILRPWKELPPPERGYCVIDDGAVEPISNGASALAPGILDADHKIKEGDEVIVHDKNGDVICSGPSYFSGQELVNNTSGKGIKNRWRTSDHEKREGEQSWDDAVKANEKIMNKRIERAKSFIKNKTDRYELPVAVSYSGGKDSLATLLLVIDSGVNPDMVFIDTGIELPETVENVEHISDKYGLNLITKKVEGGYWDSVEHFGPSARDYRWCCKTCKLGPTAMLIKDNYPDGVLSFIGQRRYESENRMNQGNTWDNPWVEGQIGVSPIQEWTALHVWLYLFSKDAEYNPWYERGMERIGCWVCPASDLSELERLEQHHPGFDKFKEVLEDYREKNEHAEIWIEFGLWRWIDIPEDIEDTIEEQTFEDRKDSVEGTPSIEEMLSHNRTKELAYLLGDDPSPSDIYDVYLKARYCVECGVCVSKCPTEALYFDQGIRLNSEACIRCKACMEKCPVIQYRSRTDMSE
ncbi:MAG: phosphoadenosine phosphosulfate reductase family protein [Thermoplasmata archaeon]